MHRKVPLPGTEQTRGVAYIPEGEGHPKERVMSSNNNTNTNSETDVPVSEGLGYPPQVFNDPEFAVNISNIEDELSNVEGNGLNFIGEYC